MNEPAYRNLVKKFKINEKKLLSEIGKKYLSNFNLQDVKDNIEMFFNHIGDDENLSQILERAVCTAFSDYFYELMETEQNKNEFYSAVIKQYDEAPGVMIFELFTESISDKVTKILLKKIIDKYAKEILLHCMSIK